LTKETQIVKKKEFKIEQIKQAAWMSLSKESQKAYQSDFKLFFDFIKKPPQIIVATDILEYIEYLEEKGFKNSTINRKIASLSKMFKVMTFAGEIKVNPVEVLKQLKKVSRKTSKQVQVTLTLKEIRKATKLTEKSTEQEKKISLIVRILASTGLRISEFINIKHKDIIFEDDDNKKIRIIGKGKKERFIFLPNELLKEAYELYPKKKDYLFYNVLEKKYNRIPLYIQITNVFQKKIGKHVRPHLLRHFFATYKINKEKKDIKAVSLYLGHSDVSTTLMSYVDTSLNSKDSKLKI